MAKKQSRRSISLSRGTYERFKVYCQERGVGMSPTLEAEIARLLRVAESAPLPRTCAPNVARPQPARESTRPVRVPGLDAPSPAVPARPRTEPF